MTWRPLQPGEPIAFADEATVLAKIAAETKPEPKQAPPPTDALRRHFNEGAALGRKSKVSP